MALTEEARRAKAKTMRYKKPICKSLNLEQIQSDLYEMRETCEDVRWFESDEENLVAALDGDEDEAFEFKMAFADLCSELERFQDDIENEWVPECFDDFFPATGIGSYDGLFGYDEFEGDYFGLTPYEYDWAGKESEKRICRMTKKELLEAAGACLKVAMSYMSVKYRYDCLEASLRILQDRNMQVLKLFKAIEEQYQKAEESSSGFKYNYAGELHELDNLIKQVPQEYWIQ